MKINRKKLNKALSVLKNSNDKKIYTPLCGVHLAVSDNKMTLRSTDLETDITATLAVESNYDFTAIVNFSEFQKLCRLQKTTDCEILRDGSSIKIDGAALADIAPSADYPVPISPSEQALPSISGKILSKSLAYVLPAVSADRTRFALCEIFFDETKIVSTDGHRLHIAEGVETGFSGLVRKSTGNAIVAAIGKNDCPVFISKSTSHVFFKFETDDINYAIISQTLNVQFPDYRQVLPKPDDYVFAKIENGASEKIETVSKLCKPAKKGQNAYCRATFDENIKMEAIAEGASVYRVDIALNSLKTVDEPPEVFKTGFNPKYLLEALNPDSTIGYKDGTSPLVIQNGNFYAVIMPARV